MLDILRKFYDKTTTTPYNPSELFCNVYTIENCTGAPITQGNFTAFVWNKSETEVYMKISDDWVECVDQLIVGDEEGYMPMPLYE